MTDKTRQMIHQLERAGATPEEVNFLNNLVESANMLGRNSYINGQKRGRIVRQVQNRIRERIYELTTGRDPQPGVDITTKNDISTKRKTGGNG